ncbi:hypothetical protein BJ508DRAFT_324762 [Ascobolus immersus RN42]|uniref:RING-type domain-containing protein n=1 Tax=Ascobolus immersus RN42 TaxID=1160509 RepID=A0A3N4IAS1_ASCIM|nr:hypothetical protein BJ508DRAFT_324762 [Ascobolus immersus RN42]
MADPHPFTGSDTHKCEPIQHRAATDQLQTLILEDNGSKTKEEELARHGQGQRECDGTQQANKATIQMAECKSSPVVVSELAATVEGETMIKVSWTTLENTGQTQTQRGSQRLHLRLEKDSFTLKATHMEIVDVVYYHPGMQGKDQRPARNEQGEKVSAQTAGNDATTAGPDKSIPDVGQKPENWEHTPIDDQRIAKTVSNQIQAVVASRSGPSSITKKDHINKEPTSKTSYVALETKEATVASASETQSSASPSPLKNSSLTSKPEATTNVKHRFPRCKACNKEVPAVGTYACPTCPCGHQYCWNCLSKLYRNAIKARSPYPPQCMLSQAFWFKP